MPDISNNDLVIAIVAITVLFLMLSGFMIVFVLLYQKRKTKHRLEMIRAKQAFEQELLRTQLEIQEQTFQNISQEIHDNIGQVLSLSKLNLNLMAPQCAHMPMMADTQQLIGKAINDLRDLSKSLNPDRISDIDLTDSIRHELQMLEKTEIFTTSFNILGSPFSIVKENKIILFRIFQEIFNNILKHAKATKVDVIMEFLPEQFQLTIIDNGQGFILDEKGNGLGLRNIRSRATLIGAASQISSSPNNGTTINIILPAI